MIQPETVSRNPEMNAGGSVAYSCGPPVVAVKNRWFARGNTVTGS
jgi:hypothetical protein